MRKENHIHPVPPAPAAAGAPRLRVVPVAPGAPKPRPGDSVTGLRPGETGAADAYLSMLQPTGRRSMRARLDRAAGLLLAGADASTFPWSTLRYDDVVYVRARLGMEGASASTVNMTLVALRQIARAARQLRQMSADDEAAVRDVKNVRAERLPAGRMLSERERELLVASCATDPSARGRRDGAVVALALGAGLRRQEIASVEAGAFDPRARTVRLKGKGDKEAQVPLAAGHARAVRAWLRLRGEAPGPLVSPVTPAGNVLAGRRVSDQAVYRAVLARARNAGIARCTPHDLRRTFISELLGVADGETARRLARHANQATTGRYDRRDEGTQRAAVERLHDPYAYTKPLVRRGRRRPRRKKGRGRARPSNLMTLGKRVLLELARAHQADVSAEMTKEEIVAAIMEKSS